MSKTNAERLILVAGATGKQGGAALEHLRKRGFPVRAITRDPEKPAARGIMNDGVEVIAADLNDEGSLRRAMDGVYGVFSVSTFHEQGIDAEIAQGKALADAANRSDVTHFVYSSVGGADQKTGIPHFDSKYQVEEYARGLGFAYLTFLRPVFFMENWLTMKDVIEGGHIYLPLSPSKKLQQVAVSDIGGVAAMAFEHRDKWNGKAIELAGDELSMEQVAADFARKTGHDVQYQQTPWDQFEQKAGHEMTVMFRWFEDHGYKADIDSLRSDYKPLTSFEQWLASHSW